MAAITITARCGEVIDLILIARRNYRDRFQLQMASFIKWINPF